MDAGLFVLQALRSIGWRRRFGRYTLCGGIVYAALCRVLGERDAKNDSKTTQTQKDESAAVQRRRTDGNDGSRSRPVLGRPEPPAQTVARIGASRAAACSHDKRSCISNRRSNPCPGSILNWTMISKRRWTNSD